MRRLSQLADAHPMTTIVLVSAYALAVYAGVSYVRRRLVRAELEHPAVVERVVVEHPSPRDEIRTVDQ